MTPILVSIFFSFRNGFELEIRAFVALGDNGLVFVLWRFHHWRLLLRLPRRPPLQPTAGGGRFRALPGPVQSKNLKSEVFELKQCYASGS